jgi:hypothetical protein
MNSSLHLTIRENITVTFHSREHNCCNIIGGALISQVNHHIERLANVYTPRVVFIHAGINNLSKEYLFESENEQLYAAIKQLDALTIMLQHLCSREWNVTVIFSLIVKCKDEFINAKSRIMNDRTTNVCKQNGTHLLIFQCGDLLEI